jgi:hypothetical protein
MNNNMSRGGKTPQHLLKSYSDSYKKSIGGITTQIKDFKMEDWMNEQNERVHDKCLECDLGFIKTRGEEQTMCVPCLYADIDRSPANA